MAKNNKGEEKGVILFVSSVAAEEAKTGTAAYGATKGALNAMMLPMARDLGRYHIRVAAIAPGIFDTDRREHVSDLCKLSNQEHADGSSWPSERVRPVLSIGHRKLLYQRCPSAD